MKEDDLNLLPPDLFMHIHTFEHLPKVHVCVHVLQVCIRHPSEGTCVSSAQATSTHPIHTYFHKTIVAVFSLEHNVYNKTQYDSYIYFFHSSRHRRLAHTVPASLLSCAHTFVMVTSCVAAERSAISITSCETGFRLHRMSRRGCLVLKSLMTRWIILFLNFFRRMVRRAKGTRGRSAMPVARHATEAGPARDGFNSSLMLSIAST